MTYISKIKHHSIKPGDVVNEISREDKLVYVVRQIELTDIIEGKSNKKPESLKQYTFNINDLEPIK